MSKEKKDIIEKTFEESSFKHFYLEDDECKLIKLNRNIDDNSADTAIFDELTRITTMLTLNEFDYSVDLDGTIIINH